MRCVAQGKILFTFRYAPQRETGGYGCALISSIFTLRTARNIHRRKRMGVVRIGSVCLFIIIIQCKYRGISIVRSNTILI